METDLRDGFHDRCGSEGLSVRREIEALLFPISGRRPLGVRISMKRDRIRLARLERFELPTRCLEGSCSIHLSYRRVG
jgi:hypothetical protein